VWQDGARVELVTVAHLLYHFSRVWDGPLKLWKLKTKACQAKRRALWELLFVPHMISCDMCWFLYHLVPIAISNMFQQKYVEVLALFSHSCSALAVNRFHWDQGCVYCVQFSMEPCFTKPNFSQGEARLTCVTVEVVEGSVWFQFQIIFWSCGKGRKGWADF